MTSAFVVFIKEETLDPAELAIYKAQVGQSFVGRDFAVRVAYGDHEVLEGPPVEGVVILEFPTVQAAREWYHSPQYQEAAAHRFKGATYRAVLVSGKD